MQAVSSVTLQNRRKEGSWAWEHKTQKCSGDLGVLLAPCTAWESRSWDVVGCWVVAAHQSYRNSGDFKGGALLQAASRIRISSWCNLKDSCKGFFPAELRVGWSYAKWSHRGLSSPGRTSNDLVDNQIAIQRKNTFKSEGLCLFLLHQHGAWSWGHVPVLCCL